MESMLSDAAVVGGPRGLRLFADNKLALLSEGCVVTARSGKARIAAARVAVEAAASAYSRLVAEQKACTGTFFGVTALVNARRWMDVCERELAREEAQAHAAVQRVSAIKRLQVTAGARRTKLTELSRERSACEAAVVVALTATKAAADTLAVAHADADVVVGLRAALKQTERALSSARTAVKAAAAAAVAKELAAIAERAADAKRRLELLVELRQTQLKTKRDLAASRAPARRIEQELAVEARAAEFYARSAAEQTMELPNLSKRVVHVVKTRESVKAAAASAAALDALIADHTAGDMAIPMCPAGDKASDLRSVAESSASSASSKSVQASLARISRAVWVQALVSSGVVCWSSRLCSRKACAAVAGIAVAASEASLAAAKAAIEAASAAGAALHAAIGVDGKSSVAIELLRVAAYALLEHAARCVARANSMPRLSPEHITGVTCGGVPAAGSVEDEDEDNELSGAEDLEILAEKLHVAALVFAGSESNAPLPDDVIAALSLVRGGEVGVCGV